MATPQKVFVLGAGAMGSLVAHEMTLAYPKQLQMILLLRNQRRLDHFVSENSEITVVKQRGENILTHKTKVTAGKKPSLLNNNKPSIIDNLIISTKTFQTESALDPYLSQINESSNILILQNGMGMADRLKERFWPSGINKPNIFQAISTHGAYKTSPNVIHHASEGKLTITSYSGIETDSTGKPILPDFINLILKNEALNASYLSYDSFILAQMEKLIINACINPLTAILDCLNGDLLYGSKIVPLMRRVVVEATQVFRAEFNILQAMPSANTFLEEDRLLNSVLEVCKSTSQNSSSMREDVKHLNQTEIDWINGYIVYLGSKHSISTQANKMLVSMIKNKLSIDKAIEENASKIIL